MNRSMAGLEPKHVIGQDSAKIFPARLSGWYRKTAKKAFQNALQDHFQYSTDDSKWWEIRLVPIRLKKRVMEVMILCTDVTERRILQAKAIRHARLATIGVLSAGVAHEINNPNSAILFNTSVVSRSWNDVQPILDHYAQENGDFLVAGIPFSEAKQTVTTLISEISHNTHRVKNIIKNLKHLAKQDTENQNHPLDLHETLQAAIMVLNHKIRRYTDYFDFQPGKGIPPLMGNPPQLEQVFINTILNALQSLPNRKHKVRVWTKLEKKGDYVQIVIQDEGCGILPEHLSRLTEAFFTTRMDSEGTGLGLSISNLIMRKHKGTIRFQSQPNQGTTVTIRLPTPKD